MLYVWNEVEFILCLLCFFKLEMSNLFIKGGIVVEGRLIYVMSEVGWMFIVLRFCLI